MSEIDAGLYGSGLSATIAKLMSGDVFTGLRVDLTKQRAVALETVLQKVVDSSTKVVWIGNPLRSPLTIERFLLQIIGPEVDLRIERSPAELARLIAHRDGVETRLLIIVQQPETIDPQTLEQLGALAGHLGEEAVQVQFLFVGSSALRLPNVARAELPELLPLPAHTHVPAEEPAEDPVQPATRRRDVVPLILLLLLSCLGVVILLAPPNQNVPTQPLSTTATISPLRLTDVDLLRRKFDAFLDERAIATPLSAAQKDALFNEFLTYHRRE